MDRHGVLKMHFASEIAVREFGSHSARRPSPARMLLFGALPGAKSMLPCCPGAIGNPWDSIDVGGCEFWHRSVRSQMEEPLDQKDRSTIPQFNGLLGN